MRDRWDELADAYLSVYREPPYGEDAADAARFRETVVRHSKLPGFALATVRDGEALGGFAYGVGHEPGWWHPAAATPAPPWLAGSPLFYVYELAVLPDRRGRGHGGGLLRDLLAGRPEPFAVLAAAPAAPAYAMYLRWGWERIGALTPGPALLARPLDVRVRG
ncbi:GNAT family N-acetyltransferase [Amycolatopsis vancoresmycina]|uniref:GCN5-related N-acetyltransferase n=1 Tax=Amycolatopsis vancoresmycina DSM 44592 TaxID=1292037 RepID=R1HK37_9PSEU|nr:GNAT family N-acetyltransferase [Amycolatopsis vancoresmycina]EOD63920.1 GCN5-related N-acetyltransferase [Amycolatopsis vancoresmycina DSM 44592]